MCLTFFIMATTFTVMGDKQMLTPAGICVGRDCFEIMSVIHIWCWHPWVYHTGFCSLKWMLLVPACFPTFREKDHSQFNLNVFVQEHYTIKS